LKVEFCKSRVSLSLIDLPGRAFVGQHSGCHEVIQSRLLCVTCLGADSEWQKKEKAKDERRTKAWGQDCRAVVW
jgi:hypothetical protein